MEIMFLLFRWYKMRQRAEKSTLVEIRPFVNKIKSRRCSALGGSMTGETDGELTSILTCHARRAIAWTTRIECRRVGTYRCWSLGKLSGVIAYRYGAWLGCPIKSQFSFYAGQVTWRITGRYVAYILYIYKNNWSPEVSIRNIDTSMGIHYIELSIFIHPRTSLNTCLM